MNLDLPMKCSLPEELNIRNIAKRKRGLSLFLKKVLMGSVFLVGTVKIVTIPSIYVF